MLDFDYPGKVSVYMSRCVYVHVYVYMYVCMYVYVYVYICMYVCVDVDVDGSRRCPSRVAR